jgi:hypothetical protein
MRRERLYAPYLREEVLAAGEWTMLDDADKPNVQKLLRGVEIMPAGMDLASRYVSVHG